MAEADVPAVEVGREQLLEWYEKMALIRRVEELAAKAYTLRKILGFCHLYIGQEAVAVGAVAALNPDDQLITAYRLHGHAIAKGITPKAVLAELFGKATGAAHGVGGSMHMASKAVEFWGGYGIVGAHVPLGAGAAFANKYTGDGRVSMTFLGDGAAQQGAFYEAICMAQLWRLPAVFVVENNYYAMGTSVDRQSYLTDMSQRGAGVGMKHWQFEAFDVVDVYRNLKAAVDHARSGEGPVLLEAVTYRYRGHSMSDPAKYRKDGELESHRKEHDGLKLAEMRLKELGMTDDELKAVVDRVKAEAQEAYDFAEQSPEPDPAKLYDYTYAEP
ncbi:MAG: pyruvate dehydrogenase (acetyl-transferring) E1 component subunit alpha [Alphaproteobacteria bacterium]|nr:pyruvate dehydrogenase (acetyl-transferring) E1 component subunit alpha [Alphaproteobacteria bacterium]MCB9692782.1 pyruvate dehydrogenase (acetyl-transferring) E1 component subunit alpha [Alphaproteobacteria bacterium]